MTGYLQDVSCASFSKFDRMRDEDYWQTHDTLLASRPTMSKSDYKELEQTMGATLNASGERPMIHTPRSNVCGTHTHTPRDNV